MATAPDRDRGKDPLSPMAARAKLAEALVKLDISEEEAPPLVLDDCEEGPEKWMLAGKVLHRNVLNIQTITNTLRPAWAIQKVWESDLWEEKCSVLWGRNSILSSLEKRGCSSFEKGMLMDGLGSWDCSTHTLASPVT